MKYQGRITDPKDLVTKEYVDDGLGTKGTVDSENISTSVEEAGINATSLDGHTSSYFQRSLVSGTTIKTINGQTLIGAGDITVSSTDADVVQTSGTYTDKVMSQNAVTEYPAFNKVVPTSAMLKNDNDGYAESVDTFTSQSLYRFSVIRRGTMVLTTTINHYRSYSDKSRTIVGYFVNDSNFTAIEISGYSLILKHVINGVATTITLMSNINSGQLNAMPSYYTCYNLKDKRILIKEIINETLTTLVDYDCSDLDYSFLTTFKVIIGLEDFSSPFMVDYCVLNEIYDEATFLNIYMNYADYNSFAIDNRIDNRVCSCSGVRVAGTVTTIDDFHKTSSVSQSSYGYFALGVLNSSINANSCISVKFKVTNMSADTKFGAGAGWTKFIIKRVDNDQTVYAGTGYFTPEDGVWYQSFIQTKPSQTMQDYCSLYGFRAQGTFNIEVIGGYVSIAQQANICGETYNGTYFSGALPFKGYNVNFSSDYSNATSCSSNSKKGLPLKLIAYSGNNVSITTTSGWKILT